MKIITSFSIFSNIILLLQDVRIDWTLNVSTFIHLLVVIVALLGAYYKLNQRQVLIENKLDLIYQWWKRRVEMLEEEERKRIK